MLLFTDFQKLFLPFIQHPNTSHNPEIFTMKKLQMFQDKVKKITIEQIRSKEKQVLEDLEKKNGIKNENLQEANDYLSNKFMNFFTARKISYLKYYKEEKGEEKNEKDFLSSIKSQLIIVYQNNGKVVFSFMTFKEISEKLKLNKTINENNEYIKKNLNKIDVKKVLDIKEQEFKLVMYEKLKKFSDFKTIVEQLDLTVY
ncbi:hypothetical protein ABPG74_003058 [Tetrahymena malaccensis]